MFQSMPQASVQPSDLREIGGFLHAAVGLAHLSAVARKRPRPATPPIPPPSASQGRPTPSSREALETDPRVGELHELAAVSRRLADIVLSASDADDVPQALDEAFAHQDFQRFSELRMGVMFSLREPIDDPLQPLEVREALLASCYTVLAVLARDVAAAEGRIVPPWLSAALDRYAQAGLDAVQKLPMSDPGETAAMIAKRDAREQRIAEMFRQAADSGQEVFWPFGELSDD
jgi:hypothetical protein